MMLLLRSFAVLLLVGSGACRWELNDPGTEPHPDEFAFPSTLLLDPDGRHLYVTSANADLRFGGGMLHIVDVARFECARQAFAGQALGPSCDPAEAMADAADCYRDPNDPAVVDCEENRFILANSTVKLGNFAGKMALQRTGPLDRTLFVVVRGDPSITYIDVDYKRDLTRPGILQCIDDLTKLEDRAGYDATTNTSKTPIPCDASHLLQKYDCKNRQTCTADVEQIPIEPFGLALDQGTLPNGDPYAHLLVSHLFGAEVQLIDTLARPPATRYVSDPMLDAIDSQNRRGGFSLAPQFPGVYGTNYYLTSNLQSNIATFRLAELGVILPGARFSVRGAFASGADVRDLQFEPGGQRAFFTENQPPSLAVLDTSPQRTSTGPGLPNNKVTGVVGVCQSPSHFAVRQVDGHTRIYVVCFLGGQVLVVDPDLRRLEDTILVGRGPNELALNFGDAQLDEPSPAVRRGYVSNFTEATIAVLDLTPGSPSYNRVIGRIGLPGEVKK